MRRRAVLAALGTAALAGCGWNQEQEGSGPTGGEGGGTPTPADLAESEGGEGPIEADAGELLLAAEHLGSEWEEANIQRTGTCNAFQRSGEEYTFTLETCAAVYDDEETATEEYESTIDTSLKVMSERLDLEPEIGDQAAVVRENERDGEFGETVIRVLFRDTNATGLVDFTKDIAGPPGSGENPNVPERGESDAVEWAATMHGNWRS